MPIIFSISPHGRPSVQEVAEGGDELPEAIARRICSAFDESAARGLLHLATVELQATLPLSLGFARDFAGRYLTRLCHTPDAGEGQALAPVAPPPAEELGFIALSAPPMRGLEYLNADALAVWWNELDALVRDEAGRAPGGVQAYLREKNPLWRLVGRVTFHLAENKRDPQRPFAFLATYASRLSAHAKVQHQPLGRALREYGAAKDRPMLLSLLMPLQRAAERSELAKELLDSQQVYHPLAWTPREAYRFFHDIPKFEESGLVVRVPDWWKPAHPPRPVVSVKIGDRAGAKIGADAMLDFSVNVALDGVPLSEQELREILQSAQGLVRLKGKWVEVDREKLAEALDHWKEVEREAKSGGLTFFEGMRLLSGAPLAEDSAAKVPEAAREWSGLAAGAALESLLHELRNPEATSQAAPRELKATLRPYQQAGVNWLRFMTQLGLGACLADDMGLGKTIQVISLLLHLKQVDASQQNPHPTLPRSTGGGKEAQLPKGAGAPLPSLLVVPASLIANWKAEIKKFAPSISFRIAHPSEESEDDAKSPECDLLITSYGMLTRKEELRQQKWRLVILDEAQAIKNSGTRQTRAVKELDASGRIALTGTPVENRLSDLWSLFDFLNPGLLGSSKAFSSFTKQLAAQAQNSYGPLRTLVRPYILRRLKTDKRVIADLPDKIETTAYCSLTRPQAVLYEKMVGDLAKDLEQVEGIERKGLVLAYLMRLKQLCNHPSQVSGDGAYDPAQSGKFQRLREICEELAERQEKVLVFSQFREITDPLADFLAQIFGRPGLILHGQTPVGKRRELVDAFQREQGPPFFVLSLKAGGTGLNLTAASHVIHFDRWWNPAVENQATDRAFRIGQQKNVFVHKFVCRGTVEDRIDDLIAQKSGLARDLLDTDGQAMLTEMNNDQLLRFVALDINKALDG
jgi:superfamily II DNA or RNA helicase